MAQRCSAFLSLLCLCAALLVPSSQPLLASAGCGSAVEDTVRAAIATAWREHIDAAKRKNLDAVTRIYDDDIVYLVDRTQVHGRTAIDSMEAAILASADVIDAVHGIESLNVFGDVAYEIGTIVGPIRVHGRETSSVTFHFMAMWRRHPDGDWRIRYLVGQTE